jgi:hypothetical protein
MSLYLSRIGTLIVIDYIRGCDNVSVRDTATQIILCYCAKAEQYHAIQVPLVALSYYQESARI